MNIKHITSESLRSLLRLTEKKEQLIKAVADVETEIADVLGGAASTLSGLVGTGAKVPAQKPAQRTSPQKPAKKKKRTVSPEARAKMAAAAKARWASKRTGK